MIEPEMLVHTARYINWNFAMQQGMSYYDILEFEYLCHSMDKLLSKPERYAEKHIDVPMLIQQIEFNMQQACGFVCNANFHKYWFQVKGCSCPKMDNRERIGTKFSVIDMNCMWHGGV